MIVWAKKTTRVFILLGIVEERKVVATIGSMFVESFQAGFIFKVS